MLWADPSSGTLLLFIGLAYLLIQRYRGWSWQKNLQQTGTFRLPPGPTPLPPPTTSHLIVIKAGQSGLMAGTRFPLAPINTIGRSQNNGITLADWVVSEQHARLYWDGSNWVIEDLRSTNGTYLCGNAISTPSPMKHGDTLRIGQLELILLV
jgi:hypothetical protein